MQMLENIIGEIASTDIPVLLVGESGTGKEMLATRVHQLSTHAQEPLRRIPCASVSPAILSAELGLNSNGTATRMLAALFFLMKSANSIQPAKDTC